jgi:peptidoglycan hydrolase CwlO-like protein
MSKITKIESKRDRIIDQLIDDKNRLYLRKKRAEKEVEVLKNQNKYLQNKIRNLEKRLREKVNAEFNSGNKAN